MGDSPENSPAIFIRGGELRLMRYCWRTYFKVLVVLFLASDSPAFLPSKKACRIYRFRHFWVRQQYPSDFCDKKTSLHVYSILVCKNCTFLFLNLTGEGIE